MKTVIYVLFSAMATGIFAGCFQNGALNAQNLSAEKFQQALIKEKGVLIDVRTPEEYKEHHIEGALNFNVEGDDFIKQIDSLDRSQPYFVYCRSGKRSAKAVEIMNEKKFAKAYNLEGGILEWKKSNFPVSR